MSVKRSRSVRQERRTGKLFYKGKPQPGSGCGKDYRKKGDVKTDYFLIECKRTDANSIVFKLNWFDKIKQEAKLNLKMPCVSLELQQRRFILLEESDFIAILEEKDSATLTIHREATTLLSKETMRDVIRTHFRLHEKGPCICGALSPYATTVTKDVTCALCKKRLSKLHHP